MYLAMLGLIVVGSLSISFMSSVVYAQPSRSDAWKTFRANFYFSASANISFQTVPHRLDTAYSEPINQLSGEIRTPLVTGTGQLLYTVEGGKTITLLDPGDGETKLDLDEKVGDPPILVSDNLALVSDTNGRIYSIHIRDASLEIKDKIKFRTAHDISMVLVADLTAHVIGNDSKIRTIGIKAEGILDSLSQRGLPDSTSPRTDLVLAQNYSCVATRDNIWKIPTDPAEPPELMYEPDPNEAEFSWIIASPNDSRVWVGSNTLVLEFDVDSDRKPIRISLPESKKLLPVFVSDKLVLLGNSTVFDSMEIIIISDKDITQITQKARRVKSDPIADSSGIIFWLGNDQNSNADGLFAFNLLEPTREPQRLVNIVGANDQPPAFGPDRTLFIPGTRVIHKVEAPVVSFIESEKDIINTCLGDTTDVIVTVRDQGEHILADHPIVFRLSTGQNQLLPCEDDNQEPSNQIDSTTDSLGQACVRWIASVEGTLTLEAGSVSRQISLQLGEGNLVVDKDSLDFQATTIVDTTQQYLTLKNNGSCALQIDTVYTSNFEAFGVDSPRTFPLDIINSSSLNVRVDFHPDTTRTYHESLYVVAGDGNTYTVSLSGEGLFPITISPDSLDFGRVPFLCVDTLAATLTNISQQTVNLRHNLDDPFRADDFPASLGPGQGQIHVEFRPESQDSSYNATMAVEVNRSFQGPNLLQLQGAGNCAVAVTPDTFDFGDVQIFSAETLAVKLENLTQRMLAVSAALSPPFTLRNFPESLASRDTKTVYIEFEPEQRGAMYLETLSIFLDDSTWNSCELFMQGTAIDTSCPMISHLPPEFLPYKKDTTLKASASTHSYTIEEFKLFYRPGGAGFYEERGVAAGYDTMSFAADSTVIIPAKALTERGLEYYIQAIDEKGCTSFWPDVAADEPPFHSLQVELPGNTLDTTIITEKKKYTLISMPADFESSWNKTFPTLAENLRKRYVALWRFDRDLAASETAQDSPYVRISKADIDMVGPGDALMAYATVPIKETIPNSKTFRTDRPFEIPLWPGWNLFSSPFHFEIPLANLKPARPIRILDNKEWPQPDHRGFHFKPWQGYAVKTSRDDTLLLFPSTQPVTGTTLANAAAVADWLLQIRFVENNLSDRFNQVGIIQDANGNWDKYEIAEAPPLGNSVSLYFNKRDWPERPGLYTTDFRPPGEESYEWPFEVSGRRKGSACHLEFSGVKSLAPDMEVWLFDEMLGHRQDLRQNPRYEFVSPGRSTAKRFRLAVGRDIRQSAPIPTQIELSPNFPNPFNPATTIRFGLPEATSVSIDIFDITGRLVRRLVLGKSYDAGYHNVVWDGRNSDGLGVSSGVYLLRLRTKELTVHRKMMLLR